ncbi:MAG: tRNA (adenosine(37)-N6)-threonylcarbamoyltransferase complex dimerization subunit type 1 TsaB [candidate division Zixibacteria bacterium]|nr:tRNA (adenosine(37)-N6)-threonylcarbamoyltransferase complex dimerization subunit type 1 TsaB [candidate division Zixibacteria bacterium]
MTDFSNENILAIDCSGKELNLGLRFGHDRMVKLSIEAGRSHGQLIIEKISDLLKSAEMKVKQLKALVVSTGPGSFTGLRIALAAAKGMATALNIPAVGVSLFEIAAFKLSKSEQTTIVIVPFKRDSVFAGEVKSGEFNNSSIRVILIKQLKDDLSGLEVVSCGFDQEKIPVEVKTVVSAGSVSFDTADLLQIGFEKLMKSKSSDLADLEPLYVQKSQAEINFEQAQRDRN